MMPGSSISAPMREKDVEKLAAREADAFPCARTDTGENNESSPEVGATRPAIIFMVVDLPAPFLPTNP